MKLLALNSGGIDSPVAMHMLLKHGHTMDAVIFDLQPFTDAAAVTTAVETVERLEDLHDTDIPVHVVPHGFVQEAFLDDVSEKNARYACLFSRRMMLRTAEALAEDIDADGLVTGESIGQVASQTLDNILVTGDAVKIPVFRPLIGLNKQEIVDTAEAIETFDMSTAGGIQCAAHVDYPETHGGIAEMTSIEEQFDVESMVRDGLEQARP